MGDVPAPVPAGVWRHHMGNHYLVLGLARHDTTDEPLVIYVRLYSRDGLPMSARPLSGWLSEVEIDGVRQPRFTFVGAADPGPDGGQAEGHRD